MSDPAASLAALGPIMQLSYCPRDYDAALSYWIGMGAGPFSIDNRMEGD